MNESTSPEQTSLSTDGLHVGIGQFLEHLQRLGVSHLPRPDEASVSHWVARFDHAPSGERVDNEQSKAVSDTQQTTASNLPTPESPARAATPAQTRQVAAQEERDAGSLLPAANSGLQAYQTPALPIAQRQAELDTWRARVSQCTLCNELACTRKHTVFGEGSCQARVCFFGEAPGADEDRQGVPFVGRAGQLLTKIIEASKLRRDDVYILNTLKCRPPGNRNPAPEELANCRQHFEAQFEIIQPEYIVCLGLFAAQSLLDSTQSIGRMRGRFHAYRGSKVVVTYHPAYLLRNEKMKGATWQDMQMLMRDMGLLDH